MFRLQLKLWLACAVVSALSGCVAKTTVVDYQVRLEANYLDAQQQKVEMVAEPTTTSARLPARLSPFPLVHYQDPLLSFDIDVRSNSIALYYLQNRSAQPLRVRWDQALVSSSQQPKVQPLTSVFQYQASHELSQLLAPGVVTFARIYLDAHQLYNSGRLFDTQYEEETTRLSKSGVGEWLLLQLPIESGTQRWMMQLKLTAADAKGRLTYTPHVM